MSSKQPNLHALECLELLGRPDRKIGPVIHVAGTNGKGSVCMFLMHALRKAGVKTGIFTSPHLVRLNERIAIGTEQISDEDLSAAFERVRDISDTLEAEGRERPSYFEFLFLMAMVYFAAAGTEAVVLETGLGGRLDATNSIPDPVLTVITSVSRDHMRYLGDTISEIAAEKAGILKSGVPCVYDASDSVAARVISEKAGELSAPAYALRPEDVRIRASIKGVIDFSTAFRYDGLADFRIRSSALWQAHNAALAVLALETLKKTGGLPEDKLPGARELHDALEEMSWPARMEEILPDVFLDGAHNEDAVRRFKETVIRIKGMRKAHLLFSVVADKDYSTMVRLLAEDGLFEDVIAAQMRTGRALEGAEIARLFRENGYHRITVIPSLAEAFAEILRRKGDGIVFICGSLYLAGEIRKQIRQGDQHDQF